LTWRCSFRYSCLSLRLMRLLSLAIPPDWMVDGRQNSLFMWAKMAVAHNDEQLDPETSTEERYHYLTLAGVREESGAPMGERNAMHGSRSATPVVLMILYCTFVQCPCPVRGSCSFIDSNQPFPTFLSFYSTSGREIQSSLFT
jgi:hypothetical protein